MKDFFNVSNNRETSCIWRFIVNPDQEAPFSSVEKRLLPNTSILETVEANRRNVETAPEIIEIIKSYRKPAALAAAG
jgi:hypothetical protein